MSIRKKLLLNPQDEKFDLVTYLVDQAKLGICPSITKIAKGLNKSTRTIHRWRDQLSDFKIVIYYDKKLKGYVFDEWGISGLPDRLVSPVGISQKDGLLLAIAGQMIELHKGTPLYDTFKKINESIIYKNKILKDESNWEKEAGKRIIFKPQPMVEQDTVLWERMVRAVLGQNICQITHVKPFGKKRKATSIRTVQPLGLVCHHFDWYVITWDVKARGYRYFAMWRIKKLEVTQIKFDYPKDFTPAGFVEDALGQDPSNGNFIVKLKFKSGYERMIEERKYSKEQKVNRTKDGSTILEFTANGEFGITRWVLGWGSLVEVLEPQKLRDEVQLRAKEMYDIYNKP